MDARETTLAYNFLSASFPSKEFLPVLGVLNSTMHKWRERGYFPLESAGRGKILYLDGGRILHLYALHLISKNSGSLKLHLRGLRDSIAFYVQSLSMVVDEAKEETTYCCLRFILGTIEDYEWELTDNPLNSKGTHIVEAFGTKAEPIFTILNLDEMVLNLVKKFEHLL